MDERLRQGAENGNIHTLYAAIRELLRLQGKERIIPLHYVAEKGYVYVLDEFLLACQASVVDLTIRRETALHIAVRNRWPEAFRVLFEWVQWQGREEILSRTHEEGNNGLHIASYTNQPKVARLIINNVGINKMNFEGSTALDIVLKLPKEPDT
ncbi:hypothetical protein F0562_007912 [Nyssa sinensis]|uniref:Uncharacterized protein n=1 Tax=Nyssa sinensis TaxID=561372 RepID=A0A5J5A7I8_9ASTE|nr:hypothetical protein F0562_007912 [Nyssa sinensis]